MFEQEYLLEMHYSRCKDKAQKSYDVIRYKQVHMSK